MFFTEWKHAKKKQKKLFTLGDSGFFQTSRYQGIVKATVSGVFEDLQFWSEPSEILNVRSSSTPETVAF